MQTPYEILGISLNASDNDIKQAYLQQVKENPPDRDAETFQCIHEAYLSIKDAESRLKHDLFTLPDVSFEDFLGRALHSKEVAAIDAESLQSLLMASVVEANFSHVFAGAKKQ